MRFTTIYNNPVRRATVTDSWVYWDDAFTNEELDKIVEYCDPIGTELGTTFGSENEEDIKKTRISGVKFHERNEKTAWIFDRLNFVIQSANEMFYGFELNGYDSFQYTTYNSKEQGRYDWHMDMAMGDMELSRIIQTRKLSLTLCLNDEFEGGQFEINVGKQDYPEQVALKKGRAILFPSFMIHRVAPVTSGIRKSLVVWATGPKFV
jgi:PKHD-type hydroxylase